jgi:hypothetical protein
VRGVRCAAGAGDLVGFTELDAPAPGYRFIVAPGGFTGTGWPGVGTPYAAFRFGSGPPSRRGPAGAARARTTTRRRRPATSRPRSTVARFLGVDSISV